MASMSPSILLPLHVIMLQQTWSFLEVIFLYSYEVNIVIDSVIAYNTLLCTNIDFITSHYVAPYNLTIRNTAVFMQMVCMVDYLLAIYGTLMKRGKPATTWNGTLVRWLFSAACKFVDNTAFYGGGACFSSVRWIQGNGYH